MDALYNDLVSAYKLAKPGIKHPDAGKYVKQYFDTIKKKPNATKLGKVKITEWKRSSSKRKASLLYFWKNVQKHKIIILESNAQSFGPTEEIRTKLSLPPQPEKNSIIKNQYS